MADANLSAMLGTDCARLVHDALPRIEKQIYSGAKQATVNIRFVFTSKKGEISVQVAGSEKIAAPVHERKLLSGQQGQLSLFEND